MDESWQKRGTAAEQQPERRRPRQSLMLQAELKLSPDLPPVEVRVRNLSAGGALVACRACPGLGDRIHITIKGIGEIAGSVARTSPNTVAITFDQSVDVSKAQTQPPKASSGVQIHHRAVTAKRPGLSIK
jgi:hypothetical protein